MRPTKLRSKYPDDPKWRDIAVVLFTHELAFDEMGPALNIVVNNL